MGTQLEAFGFGPEKLNRNKGSRRFCMVVKCSSCQRMEMSKPVSTAENSEEHWDELQGPLGLLMRAAGEVMASRLQADAKGLDALSDEEMLDMFYSAVRQAAPAIYPLIPQHRIEAMLDQMFAEARMDMAATAASTEAMN